MKESSAEKLKNLVKDMNPEDKKKVAKAIITYTSKQKENVSALQSILDETTEITIPRKKGVNIKEIQRLIFELDDDDWFKKSKEERTLILGEKMGIKIHDISSNIADEDDEHLITHTN